MIGIVSRRDLLAVFRRADADIRQEITDSILGQALNLPADAVAVVRARRPQRPSGRPIGYAAMPARRRLPGRDRARRTPLNAMRDIPAPQVVPTPPVTPHRPST
ncbi:hypothetical protein CS0771_47550 [Catellatospora sp. IY07-71]|nr:hypothetical protein CS0771_47550 [Catellatospora sp. IY07-71]